MNIDFNQISNQAGFLGGDIYFIPNRSFLPVGLIQTTCEGKNLSIVGSTIDTINAGSISFNKNDVLLSTLGEYVERYSASFYYLHKDKMIFNKSFNELKESNNLIPFKSLRFFKDDQYIERFPFTYLTKDSKIDWIKGFCHVTKKEILVPCELVFMPYQTTDLKYYFGQTSTGLASHTSPTKALIGGFLESEERNAFSNWWYRQQKIRLVKYSSELILKNYPDNMEINSLLKNDRVKISFYDLGDFSNVETITCFIEYTFKYKKYISIGCSSRFNKEEAIIKATLEAYQGVDYAILLCNREGFLKDHDINFNLIDNFDKHFAFYNEYQDFRNDIPIFHDLFDDDNYSEDVISFKNKIKNISEKSLNNASFSNLISINLTTEDVKSLGYSVNKVIVPGNNLLTGNFSTPFLGLFEEEDLFINYPHPFP